jgi:hypothetical protein
MRNVTGTRPNARSAIRHHVMNVDVMTKEDTRALIIGNDGEDQARLVFDYLAVRPLEAEQVGNTIKAARWFAGQQRVTVIGHTHKPPVYRSVKKSRL